MQWPSLSTLSLIGGYHSSMGHRTNFFFLLLNLDADRNLVGSK